MTKPLNEFGGWLRFFYVINWITTVAIIVGVLLFTATLMGGEARLTKYVMAIIAVDAISASLFVKMLMLVKVQAPETPGRILHFMAILTFLSLAFGGMEIALYYASNGQAEGIELKSVLRENVQMSGWFLFWSNYFRKSKRVAAFYGTAAVS